MAVKYKLDEEARDELDRRVRTGQACIDPANDGGEENETAARDAVSDILTTLFGPAGYCVEGGSPSSPGEVVVGPYKIVLEDEKIEAARAFLLGALESYEGDAEDYTAQEFGIQYDPDAAY